MVAHSPAMAGQSPDYLQATGPLGSEGLSEHIYYFEDVNWEKTPADMLGVDADKFKPIPTEQPDFGYTQNKIWLRINLQNSVEGTEDWRLYVRENFFQNYDVYVARENGHIQHLEAHTPASPFSARRLPYPELVTPIKFAAGEKMTILIAYWSGGSSHAAVSFETTESFAKFSLTRMSKVYASYGMLVILIIGAGLAILISRLTVFWAYLTYLAVTLLFLMHIDGIAFQYLWPNFPQFNSNASIIIGGAYILATYNFSRAFLRTKRLHPITDKIFVGLMMLTLGIGIIGYFAAPQITKQFSILMLFIAILAGILAGIVAAFTRFREVRFYLFAWIFGILCAVILSMRHFLGFGIPQDVEFDSLRISVIVDSIMLGLGIADRYNQMILSSQRAVQENLESSKRNLVLTNRLHDLEDQYQLAVELVHANDEEMKNTVHDLRQPLHALRLSIQNLKDPEQGSRADHDKIDETFSYLETLISEQLKRSVLPLDGPGGAHKRTAEREDERLSIPKVLKSIHEMFLPDATEKDLDFHYVETKHDANIDPLVLMRIVTNLVSNAIKYTSAGKILLAARRTKTGLRIEVHDTGMGMSAQDFEKVQSRQVHLDNRQSHAKGKGSGLAVALNLARQHGLDLSLAPNRKNGAGFVLTIPDTKSRTINEPHDQGGKVLKFG